MAASSDARAAVPRVAVAWPVVRAVEFLLVAAFTIYYGFLDLPRAAAAASSFLRVAASFAVQRYIFVVANAIVIVLFTLFLRDDVAFSSSAAALFSRWWPSDGDAQDRPYLPSPGPPLVLPPPVLPPPGETLMLQPPTTHTEAGEEEKSVFVDKVAVHVTTVRAQAPRRSKSEKTGGGARAACRRRAAAPELRRVESENGRQWQRKRAEPDVSPVEVGIDDEEAFRRYIDAYISKQQARFQCEESAAAAAASGKGGACVRRSPCGGEVISGCAA